MRIDKIFLSEEKEFLDFVLSLKDSFGVVLDDEIYNEIQSFTIEPFNEISPILYSPSIFSPVDFSPVIDSKKIIEVLEKAEEIATDFPDNHIRLIIRYEEPFYIDIEIFDLDYSPYFLIKRIEIPSTRNGKNYEEYYLKFLKLFKRVKENFIFEVYKELKEMKKNDSINDC